MPIPDSMDDLSATINSNSPAGTETPGNGDDYIRALSAILRRTNAKGSDIASATTTDIGAATAEFVDVTGTTTITGLGTIGAGIERTVRFTGALTLTHNATSLILPGSANITTANGDVAQFRSLGSGNWKCVGYIRQNGTPLALVDGSVTPAKLSDDAFIVTIGASKNLVITNNSGTPNSQVDIDADEIVLKNSSSRAYLASSVNLTANIAASGANGLDTGTEANSTWYYLWVIYNGTTVSSLISASSTAPTMPSGYTYKALVGAIYNGSGGDFIKYYQSGNDFWVGEVAATTTVPSTSYVSVSLATAVPPIAKSARISGQWAYTASLTAVNYYAPSSADDLAQKDNVTTGGSTAATFIGDHTIPLITAQTIYYKRTGSAAASGTLYCNGGKY